jgi:hypothetical protein
LDACLPGGYLHAASYRRHPNYTAAFERFFFDLDLILPSKVFPGPY